MHIIISKMLPTRIKNVQTSQLASDTGFSQTMLTCESTNSSRADAVDENIEDEEENEFFDASSEPDDFKNFEMDLDSALEEAKLAICYLFNNKFDEARILLQPYAHVSIYHSMGNAVFIFLEAILTFEQRHIVRAGDELKKCLSVCQRYKHKNTFTQSIGRKFKKTNYTQLTDLEAHAELCYAEALLLRALLTFIEDETLTSLIRGGMKIRHCYSSYKECAQILVQRQWESEVSKVHFESGVRMGVGAFNLMISLLPSSVIKVLQVIGFSGNKTAGLADLKTGYHLSGLRQVLCAMTLLGYHLIVCYVICHQEGDLELCHSILEEQLLLYPQGVWFLFFKGRLEFMKGNLDEAQYWYKKSWKSQNVWTQLHHLSFWELLWVNCLKLDWHEARLYGSYLVEQSKWSRTIYSYQQAAVMLMNDDLDDIGRQTVERLMQDAPKHKQRIAGKSLPMEKFICKKVARYFAQNRYLCLPAVELMFVWNTFKVLGKNYRLSDSICRLIELQMKQLAHRNDIYELDNQALCLLLRGACYRQMKQPFLALQDLEACMNLESQVKEDTYLVAYACVESGLVHADEQNYDLAISTIEEAKKKYTGFSLESRLNFRIHAALMELKEKLNDTT
ncbi:tetratricopeptide repeat protein 39B isoform X3 [Bactrocera dorsalis]|uniref:Tetratricopeptide repeat protein 39B n=1 Tax=Bactrocera dorsalis TaxID=27457 RepID=A0A034WBW5_BACDO|nr:tetratricopeptide repeat protein 39B isoform X3 [Bactrocera dorsalis]